jgi:hypothetical protein
MMWSSARFCRRRCRKRNDGFSIHKKRYESHLGTSGREAQKFCSWLPVPEMVYAPRFNVPAPEMRGKGDHETSGGHAFVCPEWVQYRAYRGFLGLFLPGQGRANQDASLWRRHGSHAGTARSLAWAGAPGSASRCADNWAAHAARTSGSSGRARPNGASTRCSPEYRAS